MAVGNGVGKRLKNKSCFTGAAVVGNNDGDNDVTVVVDVVAPSLSSVFSIDDDGSGVFSGGLLLSMAEVGTLVGLELMNMVPPD
mmetsp:Transcript_35533/g.41123  ORF Transcript_35533/g.41123 Transcript_35533/m.41123 type:complete len:84 (-) Transcript_35533:226-477(-)